MHMHAAAEPPVAGLTVRSKDVIKVVTMNSSGPMISSSSTNKEERAAYARALMKGAREAKVRHRARTAHKKARGNAKKVGSRHLLTCSHYYFPTPSVRRIRCSAYIDAMLRVLSRSWPAVIARLLLTPC